VEENQRKADPNPWESRAKKDMKLHGQDPCRRPPFMTEKNHTKTKRSQTHVGLNL